MNNYSFSDEKIHSSLFRCPNCGKALERAEKRLVCASGHSFDLSKEGYVNLLLSPGGEHGDNKEMVKARARFLEGGHYLPLRSLLCARLREAHPETVLDAGCGEGWYTEEMARALPESRFAAVDLSKYAAACAARRLGLSEPGARNGCAVASVYALPVGDESFDAVVSVFSPFAREEFLRVLRPGGLLLLAVPGDRHLWQMKELLYDEPYENELQPRTVEGFDFEKEDELHYVRSLSGDEARDLFAMTPYFYRTPEAGRRRAEACGGLDVEIAFHLLIYRKTRSEPRVEPETRESAL